MPFDMEDTRSSPAPALSPALVEALSLLPDGALVVDAGQRVVAANEEAAAIARCPLDALHQRRIETVLHSLDLTNPNTQTCTLRVGEGSPVPVEARTRGLPDDGRLVTFRAAALTVNVDAEHLAHVGSWSWEIGADTVTWSAELHRIYGLAPRRGPVSFDDYVNRVHPEDRNRVNAAVQRAIATQTPWEHDYRIIRPDGSLRWVNSGGEVLERVDGVPSQLGGYCRDITAQRLAEAKRQRAQDQLAAQQKILEQIVRGQPLDDTLTELCLDIETRFPGAICSILLADHAAGVLRDRVAPSHTPEVRRAVDGLPMQEGVGACGTAAHRGQTVVVRDVLDNPLTEDWHGLAIDHALRAIWSHPLTRGDGLVLGTFALYRHHPHTPDEDEVGTVAAAANLAALAIERETSQHALAQAARIDPLTGLPNRTEFLRILESRLDAREPVAVMFLDVDHFKWINDSLGHPQGDRILEEVGRRLRERVDGDHLVARFGGDEFTVLVPPDLLGPTAEAVLDAFTAPFPLDGGEFFLTGSIGSAAVSDPDGCPMEDDLGADDLIRDADAAMFRAKEQGRDQHVAFDDQLRGRALARVRSEAQIRQSLAEDRFIAHYQLAVDLRTGGWYGAEALARWNHPDGHLAPPSTFIPLAEETGLITALGRSVLAQAVAQTARWVRDGVLDLVTYNLSVNQLQDPTLPEHVAGLLEEHGLAPRHLLMEVTESAMMHHLDTARSTLDALADLGLPLVIDDFGTGFSSIARLRDLPISGVKIDRSFAVGLEEGGRAADMVAAIVGLAHAADLAVCVEGIETSGALAVARATGCDIAQGFHMARPAPADQIPALRAVPPAG